MPLSVTVCVPAPPPAFTLSFAVYYTAEEFRSVIDAFTTGRIEPAPLLAKQVSLDEVNEAFDDLASTAAAATILLTP